MKYEVNVDRPFDHRPYNGLIHSFRRTMNYNIHTRTIRTGRYNTESQCALFVYSTESAKMREKERDGEDESNKQKYKMNISCKSFDEVIKSLHG